MPCGSAAGEAGVLRVCALKYVAGISEPAINHPFANENSPSLCAVSCGAPAAGPALALGWAVGREMQPRGPQPSRIRQHGCVG